MIMTFRYHINNRIGDKSNSQYTGFISFVMISRLLFTFSFWVLKNRILHSV